MGKAEDFIALAWTVVLQFEIAVREISLGGHGFLDRCENIRLAATSGREVRVPAGSVTRRKACHAWIPRCVSAHGSERLPVCAIVSRWGKR